MYKYINISTLDATIKNFTVLSIGLVVLWSTFYIGIDLYSKIFNLIYATALVFFLRKFSKISPLQIILNFMFLIYFIIPEPFVINDYVNNEILGYGIPYKTPLEFDLHSDYIPAKLLLLISFISSSFGLRCGVRDVSVFNYKRGFSLNTFEVWLVFSIIIVFNLPILSQYLSLDELFFTPTLKFIFTDVSFLLILVASNFLNRINAHHFFLIFTIFIVLFVVSGSKAAILSVSLFFFFMNLSNFKNSQTVRGILFPSTGLIIILLTFSFVFYFAGDYFRNISWGKGSFSSELDHGIFRPFLRLGYTGLDRYFLAYSWFVSDYYNYDSVLNYIMSILKSGLNLFWPGNYYDGFYSTSSMLIPNLIDSNFDEVIYDDVAHYIASLNTQTIPLWGYMLIFAGYFGPLLVFIFSYFFSKLFYFSGHISSAFMLYFFINMFAPYGIEVAVFNLFRMFISFCLILAFIKFVSSFRNLLFFVKPG